MAAFGVRHSSVLARAAAVQLSVLENRNLLKLNKYFFNRTKSSTFITQCSCHGLPKCGATKQLPKYGDTNKLPRCRATRTSKKQKTRAVSEFPRPRIWTPNGIVGLFFAPSRCGKRPSASTSRQEETEPESRCEEETSPSSRLLLLKRPDPLETRPDPRVIGRTSNGYFCAC